MVCFNTETEKQQTANNLDPEIATASQNWLVLSSKKTDYTHTQKETAHVA